VGAGDAVLIHAASGGVGHLATQIAVARGARVIGTCSPPNHDFLRELGGEPTSYGDGLTARVRELAPDGIDAVADFAGRGALDASDDLLRAPGRVVSITDPQAARSRGGTYVFVRPEVAHLQALADLADEGRLTPHVQAVYDLEDVQDAVTEASSGKVRGKVVLRAG
jgi:NADPH:quinone reductase-like Zn-dependent oxidoreductase